MNRSLIRLLVLSLVWLMPYPLKADFLRGDANRDGVVNSSDAIVVLAAFFGGTGPLSCEDAADTNDDGRLDISDAVVTILYLFGGGGAPSNPGPLVPGPDPTCDGLRCGDNPDVTPAIVLSEIMYNSNRASGFEFVELHNRTTDEIDVSGYRLTDGISYVIPEGTSIPAGGFLSIAQDPTRLAGFRPTIGPYEGDLSNGGERITLVDGDCDLETVDYDDREPWPLRPDGYGPSLERIDYLAPADDFHSWRTSLRPVGSPARANSTQGTLTHPVVTWWGVEPVQPSSRDTVTMTIVLDVPAAAIRRATLRSRPVAVGGGFDTLSAEMQLVTEGSLGTVFRVSIPPYPTQSLVRSNVNVELENGNSVLLPHEGDFDPVFSYFVYDFELQHTLPLLWLIPSRRAGLYQDGPAISGAVVIENGSAQPRIFDGAIVEESHNGHKLRFLKGSEYRGDRTVNLLASVDNPTSGGGGTGVYREQFGFQVFRAAGAIAPRADWFRVITYTNPLNGHAHAQRAMVQQINERFLIDNRLSASGDLYKDEKDTFEMHTNEEAGNQSLRDLRSALGNSDDDAVRQYVLDHFDHDNIGLYSVVGVFMANWDGFHNNMYFYNSLEPGSRWKAFPWDLDQVCQPQHIEFLVSFPLDGVGGTEHRAPGFLSSPFHSVPELDAAYRQRLLTSLQPGGVLSADRLVEQIIALEQRLLDDVTFWEASTNDVRPERRNQIVNGYASIRTFVEGRTAYLQSVLAP